MRKTSMFVETALVLCVALFLGGSPVFAQDNEIRLGIISPASGNYADLGTAERRGIIMAVEEINSAGGVLGKQVRMIVEDDETDPAAGTRKAKKLIEQDKVHFLIGVVSSAVAIGVSEVAQRANKIYINTNTNSDECTGKYCHRTNFRVGPMNFMLVHGVAPYIAQNFGKNWYFITHDYSWGRSGTEVFRKILAEKKGTDLGEVLIPMNTRDFSSYLIKIRNLKPKPDIIMCTVGGVDRSAMFEQIKEFGMDKDFKWGFSLMDYGDIYAVGPEKGLGVFAVEWYHKLDAPGVKEFVEKYQKRWAGQGGFPIPENDTYQGYIGARELLRAVERAKSLDTTSVIKAMEGHTFSDNLKNNPTTIRAWDHQFVGDVYVARMKTPEEFKADPTDFYQIIGTLKGADVAPTPEQNPCNMEPYQ